MFLTQHSGCAPSGAFKPIVAGGAAGAQTESGAFDCNDAGAAADEMLAETASGALKRLDSVRCRGSDASGALDEAPSGAFDAEAAADALALAGRHAALCPPTVQCARWHAPLQ